jgi:branched-chain amino acid transport system substrate-binding protein
MRSGGRAMALAALLMAALPGCNSTSTPPPIYLGHVANLSGADRSGMHAEQGIRLALKLLTDDSLAESLLGRELKVRHTDTKGSLDASEAEAVRLANVSRVAGLIGGSTPEEVTRLDRARVPVLATVGVRPAGTSDMVFAVGMRPAQQACVLAKYAAGELDYTDVVVVADDRREEFLGVAEAFARHFVRERTAKGKTAQAPPVTVRFGKDANWEELAETIAACKSARALLFAGNARDWVELRRKMSASYSLPLIFAGDDGDGANLRGATPMQTIYLASAFAADRDAPRMQSFIQKYREAFKEEPTVAAALGYESLQIFAEALKESGPNLTVEKIQGALRELKDLPGLAGALAMSKEQFIRRPLYIGRFDGTMLIPLKRYEADTLP